MNDFTKLSKRLSWLLRHGANEVGLPMDAAGWVSLADLRRHIRVSRPVLERCVSENRKGRFAIDGERIRACQGHSTAGTPVTAEALEASWEAIEGRRDPVYHGTATDTVGDIARSGGLRPMARTHVHLAGAPQDRVGKRDNVGVLLVVDPAALAREGRGLFRSPNGVYLTRDVPWSCVVDLMAVSRRARQRHDALLDHLLG